MYSRHRPAGHGRPPFGCAGTTKAAMRAHAVSDRSDGYRPREVTWVAGAIITTMTTHVTSRGRYPSDLSDTAWARIAAFVVPAHPKGGRPCPAGRWRQYVNAMGYV